MILTTTSKLHLKNVFRTNMVMNGFTADQAEMELKFLMPAPLVTGTRDNYIMARRTGMPYTLLRIDRLRIYEVFATSINQVSFELGI